jgi:hypothetical protein
LVLTVEERTGGGRVFDVRLQVPAQWLPELSHATHGEISFQADPAAQLRLHFKEVGDTPAHTDGEKAALARTLLTEGAYLSGQLLPEPVRKCLSSLQGKATALHVVSDAPWIPWELLRIERDPSSSQIDGPFLCEAFALTRGLPGVDLPTRLPLTRLGVVIPRNQNLRQGQELPSLEGEWEDMRSLEDPGRRQVERIEARLGPVLDAFGQGELDGWHFSTHATFKDTSPDLSTIALESGDHLFPHHLSGEAAALGKRKPLVFLNACSSGQTGLSLTSVGGWTAQFLAAGAGACIGALWPIYDSRARTFARTFYRELIDGKTVGEAVRIARKGIKSEDNPTWLAYTAFADPSAVCEAQKAPAPERHAPAQIAESEEPLALPHREWDPAKSPPGALLRAEYGIVRFHWRARELADLKSWCLDGEPVGVRLYTGAGGMGKTRLAIEAARQLRESGWQAGFFRTSMPPRDAWKVLKRRGGRIFLVFDYAEVHRDLLVPILREVAGEKEGPIRIVLLARAALDWWELLKREGEGVGDLLNSLATSKRSVGALALSVPEREESFNYALKDFAGELARPVPSATLDQPEKEYFERALLLHMSALAAIEGVKVKGGEDEQGLLDFVLDREKKHWRERAGKIGLPETLVPGIGRALAAITLAGGVEGERHAVEVMRALRFFSGQTHDVLVAIGHLLRETYPDGRKGVEPIMPDLLGEHLVQRELEKGEAEELFNLVLGPQT